MDKAIQVFSRHGLFSREICAREIRSREHFRKLWPLVTDSESRQEVTWVRPTFDSENHLLRVSHFRVLPGKVPELAALFEQEETERQRQVGESKEHKLAKSLIAAELTRRINLGLGLPWAFNDPDSSDFPLVGNLLLGANAAAQEFSLTTPFGSQYRIDVAVLGSAIDSEPMVLGGIEIELTHAFDGRKAILGKSQGFPLITIDIAGMSLADLTPEWATLALSATTRSAEDGRRQTYIYLHDLLYPLYAQIPDFINDDQRHQFLVFDEDNSLKRLCRFINKLSAALEYQAYDVVPALVNAKNKQSTLMLERAGEIAGADWRTYNDHQCLRLTLPRPKGPHDLRSHRFHMTLARALLSHSNALVGYMYANGHTNSRPEEAIWTHKRWIKEESRWEPYRVLPKRLAEPVSRIMQVVSELQERS